MIRTVGVSDHPAAGGLLGLLLHLWITVLLSSTVGAAGDDEERLLEHHQKLSLTSP